MLETLECKEVNEGKVCFEDMDGHTLKSFWNYLLHSDFQQVFDIHSKEDLPPSSACELALNQLVLGDRYDIADLKQKAIDWLIQEMRPENALRMIKIANLVKADTLLEVGLKFVHENRKNENLAPLKILTDDMPKSRSSSWKCLSEMLHL